MLYDKYSTLYEESNGSLSYNDEGFHLDGHTFQSLNEVKKALKMKALS